MPSHSPPELRLLSEVPLSYRQLVEAASLGALPLVREPIAKPAIFHFSSFDRSSKHNLESKSLVSRSAPRSSNDVVVTPYWRRRLNRLASPPSMYKVTGIGLRRFGLLRFWSCLSMSINRWIRTALFIYSCTTLTDEKQRISNN